MTIAIVLGTRPEIIKLSPVMRYCLEHEIAFFIIHTNQHYTQELDSVFFEELALPPAKYNLAIGSGSHGMQTGSMLIEIEKVLLQEKPNMVIVQGDTNTVLAAALAASKLQIPIAHVEAGLRSYDRNMPEEVNRIVADHLSTYLLCPTEKQQNILLGEGVEMAKIFSTGNTIVDAVHQAMELSQQQSKILENLNISPKMYLLLTLHRPSNVDHKEVLIRIFEGLKRVSNKHSLPVIFPIHPRTEKSLSQLNIDMPDCIQPIKPVGYLDMLMLISKANAVLSDSGGIQEEACIIGTPCVTLRENTERPETVEVGANVVVGSHPEKIESSLEMFPEGKTWKQPFGEQVTRKIFGVFKKMEQL